MNTKRFVTIFILVLGLLLILSVGLSAAQEAQDESPPLEPASVNFGEQEYKIPIQGRLTNASGVPENDDFNVTFNVYDADIAGTLLCDDTQIVSVKNGLFNTFIEGCTTGEINGQQLYLGIKVGDDDEMTPRQPLHPVPYAYSLVPGAQMRGNIPSWSMLRVSNEGNINSTALAGIAEADNGPTTGVLGVSKSAEGSGGRFRNEKLDGIALLATGSGIFRSSAPTYLYIPGSAIVKSSTSDNTDITIVGGAAKIKKGGAGLDVRKVTLPITIPGVMYGERVRITEVRIYYVCSDKNSFINNTFLYRQKNASSKVMLMSNAVPLDSIVDTYYPKSTDPANNLLSKDSGALALEFWLLFDNTVDDIQIGMVRLQLEHPNVSNLY